MKLKELRLWIPAACISTVLIGATYWTSTSAPRTLRTTFTRLSRVEEGQIPRFIDDNGCVGGLLACVDRPGGYYAHSPAVSDERTPEESGEYQYFPFRLRSVNGKGESVGRGMVDGKVLPVFCTATGDVSPLSHLPATSMPLDVNVRGTIVGFYVDGRGGWHGFIADRQGFFRDFSDLTGRTIACCQSVNDLGCIVGKCSESGRSRAFLWTPESGFEILHLESSEKCIANAINNRGEVVGSAIQQSGRVPFIWSRRQGFRLLDEPFVDEQGNVWTPIDALDMNNRGEILVLCASILRCGYFIYREQPADSHPIRQT